ncbi:hypothetical protein CECT5772_06758 [Streptococcus equi subsp. ruminatorum CECT 5772]|uniref:Uncharacterized protein n=1 Tax=Streptococcus equi subsp. ruminatorum CECT 5772 TaxID=1051981 RepID=A0A922NU18_9STRE|nr:hypothetical protein CECT5772_06758 [Streptococcus equi subsp. ruminatorum CECT 5772]
MIALYLKILCLAINLILLGFVDKLFKNNTIFWKIFFCILGIVLPIIFFVY